MNTAKASDGGRITRWLAQAPPGVFVLYAISVSFTTYFCMYAFRKPFAAAKFEGASFLQTEIELKTAIVISQIIGYALSKYIGIKVCSEVAARSRAWTLLLLIVWAEGALVLFGLLPGSWKVAAIFLNGLPLGMVWGLVVWYLEGRRTSELLLAGLSCSYIVSSGVVKDFGRALLAGNAADVWAAIPLLGLPVAHALGQVSESWMPAVAGLHFFPILLVAVWLLNQLPKPSAADVAARAQREPMDGHRRLEFVRQFLPGIVLLCVAYLFLTAYRDFRDNYQVEVFEGLGYSYQGNRTIISKTEGLVMFGVLGCLAMLNLIQGNRAGLAGAFGIMCSGAALMGVSTLLLDAGWISGFWWMTAIGLGSYLGYVPFGSVLFDRLMASTRAAGTAVFAIYLADAIGYTGSVGVQLYKDLVQSDVSRLGFFKGFTYTTSLIATLCLIAAAVYFLKRHATHAAPVASSSSKQSAASQGNTA
jgi:hypothetical protein